MRRLSLVALLLTVFAVPSGAEVPDSVFIEDLTWVELRDLIGSGKTTAILPVGGTEQNGPHMAIGKHNFIIRHTAEGIARQLANALVAPIVAYVPEGDIEPPTGHMKWPGTITLPPEHFRKLVEYAARSFKLHGFRDVVFIGDHGSYQKDLKEVAEALTSEWKGTGVRVHFVPQYYSGNGLTAWLETQGVTKQEIGSHASITDTSQLMALDPRYIRANKLNDGTEVAGVLGDPRRSSVELGRRGLDLKIAAGVKFIRQAVSEPARP